MRMLVRCRRTDEPLLGETKELTVKNQEEKNVVTGITTGIEQKK
jgi:hypothetical protein